MPYINSERRKDFDNHIETLVDYLMSVGELNYVITRLIDGYSQQFSDKNGVDYSGYNAMIGVLECVKQEYYRRRIAPYEDEKCKSNGDVFQ